MTGEPWHEVNRRTLESRYATDNSPLPARVAVSEIYRMQSQGPHAVNSRHALEALGGPHIEGWRYEESGERFVLGTKAVDAGGADRYTIVALALEDPPGEAQLSGAWRLYDADPEWHPTEAFSEVLLRYGVDFRLGASEPTGFVAQLRVELDPDGTAPITIAEGAFPDDKPRSERDISGHFTIADNGSPANILWAFIIDESSYADDVRRRRIRPV